MIPGALTALQPIDMESYEMESPELTAQTIINQEFSNSEIILGFVISARDPEYVPSVEDWSPVPPMSDGAPDYSSLPDVGEMVEGGEPWQGISAPKGGIVNLSVLREIDAKRQIVYDHILAPALKPLVNDVTGHQYNGVMTLSDIFRGFMNGTSILTQPGINSLGIPTPAPTNWTDCGVLECLEFDDVNVTQDHIDLAALRMADAPENNFLRWLSLDRGFFPDVNSLQTGPIGGELQLNGSWANATQGLGRWSASSTWFLVQYDSAKLEEMGWEVIWKDAHQEKDVQFTDDGLIVGGYRLDGGKLVVHPPRYNESVCQELQQESGGCSSEWSYMDLEGKLRSNDRTTITLLVGQGVNVEVNRELQSSAGLIVLMGLVIVGLLYISLRRWTDVAIVLIALGAALLWMQGMIGHLANFSSWLGFTVIALSLIHI